MLMIRCYVCGGKLLTQEGVVPQTWDTCHKIVLREGKLQKEAMYVCPVCSGKGVTKLLSTVSGDVFISWLISGKTILGRS